MSTFRTSRRPRARWTSQTRRHCPRVELVEDRLLLSAIEVMNNNSSGSGSLAAAINTAETDGITGVQTIDFEISGSRTIDLTSALPKVTTPVFINGPSQATTGGTWPWIGLDYTGSGSSDGLVFESGASGSTVEGLKIENFTSNSGIVLLGSTDCTIGGTKTGDGNVLVENEFGVHIMYASGSGAGATSDKVEGNYIGTNGSFATNLGNTDDGVLIDHGAEGNIVGGTGAGTANTIGENTNSGVVIGIGDSTGNEPASSNIVEGNYIGTNADGTVALPNGTNGVSIVGSYGNTIGGTTADALNVISGNANDGVLIEDSSNSGTFWYAYGNVVEGNDIGGDSPQGNTANGVEIDGPADPTLAPRSLETRSVPATSSWATAPASILRTRLRAPGE